MSAPADLSQPPSQEPLAGAPRRRRPPLLGIAALVLAVACLLGLVFPALVLLIAPLVALGMGIVAVVHGWGRWWGAAAVLLIAVHVVVFAATVAVGLVVNPKQDAMLSRAQAIEPPVGYALDYGPTGLGWCGPGTLLCDRAQILWSYAPEQAEAGEPAAMCEAFLQWAHQNGVRDVFVVSDVEWPTWYDSETAGLAKGGTPGTYPVDSADAQEVCEDIVANPREPGSGLDRAFNLIGATEQDGSDPFVARIGERRSLPDGSTSTDAPEFDIIGYMQAGYE